MSSPTVIDKFEGDYAFLSNFYPIPGGVEYDGVIFPSVENAYQAAKCPIDKRDREWEKFRYISSAQAKKLGRRLPLSDNWESNKRSVMYLLVLRKFQQPDLKKMLLDTGEAELIEGNWWGDRYWGVCNGKGLNYLGKTLMIVRDSLNLQKLVDKLVL
jgi:ribA/ribD-fused uncharacterized protein